MKKIFLDTNIILDFLLDREPFSDHIAELLEESTQNSLELCVSSITVTTTNYIIEKFEGKQNAKKKINKLLELVTIENVGESTIMKSSKSQFRDFEDGLQNFCAIESKHKIIITRDVKGFKSSKLAILTPKELLAKLHTRH